MLRTSYEKTVGCLIIRNDALKAGTPITVTRNFFDTTAVAPTGLKVGKKLPKDCTTPPSAMAEQGAAFYEVQIPNIRAADGANGFVYVGDSIQPSKPTGWVLEGKPVAFRECASGEGLHLTVWSGKPLESKRLWHFYFYLGNSMESNCTENDVKE